MAIRIAQNVLSKSGYYEFHSKGDLHRNVLLNTLEDQGITFRDYDLSPTGIKAKNRKTEKVLQKLFKAATSPRPPCLLCVRKHIGQASALLQESLQGYPEHRDLAIGHLAEAEAEAEGISHDFAGRLRNERLKLERQEDYLPDCVDLLNISYNIKEMYGAIMTIQSRVAARFARRIQAGPVLDAISDDWNTLHDIETNLVDARATYGIAASYSGGPGERDARKLVQEIDRAKDEVDRLASKTFSKISKMEMDFSKKYGDVEDYIVEMRNKMFPR